MTSEGVIKLKNLQKRYFASEYRNETERTEEKEILKRYNSAFEDLDDECVLKGYTAAVISGGWKFMPSEAAIYSAASNYKRSHQGDDGFAVYRCCDCGMKWGRSPEIKEPGKYYCRMCGAEVSERDDPFDAIPRGIARQYQPSRKMSLEQYVEKYPFSSLAKKAGKLGDLKKFGRFDGDPVEVSLADADYWIGKDKRIGQMWEAIKFSCRFKVVAGGETDDDAYDRMARFMEYYVPGWKRPVPVSGYYLAEQIEF